MVEGLLTYIAIMLTLILIKLYCDDRGDQK